MPAFDPSQHPRGPGGQFITSKSSGAAAKGAKKKLGGKLTTERIRMFQRRHGLKVDGVIGKQTAAALLGSSNAKDTKTGALTASQKKQLASLGGQPSSSTSKKRKKKRTTGTP